MDFVDEINIKLKRHGITQKDLAVKSGLTERTISLALNHKRKLHKCNERKIESAINELIKE